MWAWQPDTDGCRQLPSAGLPKLCTQAVLVPADAPEAAGGAPVLWDMTLPHPWLLCARQTLLHSSVVTVAACWAHFAAGKHQLSQTCSTGTALALACK